MAVDVVGVDGAEHVVAVAAAVTDVVRCAFLVIETVAARIMHESAVAVAETSWVVCAVAAVAAVVVVVVCGSGFAASVACVGGVAGAAEVGAIGVVACLLAFGVVAGVVVVIAGNLYLLWPRGRARIAISCALDFFWLCVVIQFAFCGF